MRVAKSPPWRRASSVMDTILVVNAGSSSVKFEVFAIVGTKGWIGSSRDRWTASVCGRACVHTAPTRRSSWSNPMRRNAWGIPQAALETAGVWLHKMQKLLPVAVGHRVVHGGPEYDRPVLIDQRTCSRGSNATCRSRRCTSRTTLRRSALILTACLSSRRSPVSTRPSTAAQRVADHFAIPSGFMRKGAPLRLSRPVL